MGDLERNEAECRCGYTWAESAPTTKPFAHSSMSRPGRAEVVMQSEMVTGALVHSGSDKQMCCGDRLSIKKKRGPGTGRAPP